MKPPQAAAVVQKTYDTFSFPPSYHPQKGAAQIIYINGINTDRERAEETAEKIFSVTNFSGITVFWHQTTLAVGKTPFFPNRHRDEFVERFSHLIMKTALTAYPQKVTILAHSYGALITKRAFDSLAEDFKKCCRIITCGPASIIEKHGDLDIVNYIHEGDAISRLAHLPHIASKKVATYPQALVSACQTYAHMKLTLPAPDSKSFQAVELAFQAKEIKDGIIQQVRKLEQDDLVLLTAQLVTMVVILSSMNTAKRNSNYQVTVLDDPFTYLMDSHDVLNYLDNPAVLKTLQAKRALTIARRTPCPKHLSNNNYERLHLIRLTICRLPGVAASWEARPLATPVKLLRSDMDFKTVFRAGARISAFIPLLQKM